MTDTLGALLFLAALAGFVALLAWLAGGAEWENKGAKSGRKGNTGA
jgi:hypothetical protein